MVTCSRFVKNLFEFCVVVQHYPWFYLYLSLFDIYQPIREQWWIKTESRDKIEPQHFITVKALLATSPKQPALVTATTPYVNPVLIIRQTLQLKLSQGPSASVFVNYQLVFSFIFSFPFLQATIYSYDHIFEFPGWLLIACIAGWIFQPIAFLFFSTGAARLQGRVRCPASNFAHSFPWAP